MADLTDSTLATGDKVADGDTADFGDGSTGDGVAHLTVPYLLELDLDGPTLEILLAALTAAVCDAVDVIDA
jgi:hypothetical protein